jgi:hypothetical protein
LVTENAAEIKACDAITAAGGGQRDQRVQRPFGGHLVERVARLLREVQQHRALAEVVEHQAGHHQAEPGDADRPLAEVAHVGIQRLGTGHAQHDEAERDEGDGRVEEEETQRMVRD